MMRLPAFTYVGAKDLSTAVSALAENPQSSRLVAGGTDLWPNFKRRHQGAESVIGLRKVKELHGLGNDPAKELRIGAMTTLTAITRSPLLKEHYPGFVRAVASISSPVLRNMGTIGGNLCLDTRCTYYNQNEEWRQSIGYCMKEVGDICWVATSSPRCWAIAASDSAPLLCALGARVRLVSKAGERVISVADLFNDDGIAYLSKQRDEILTEVLLPAADPSLKSTYWKLRRRGSIDFPVLGVGAALRVDSGNVVQEARIFLGGVRSAPIYAKAACDHLLNKPLTAELIAEAADLARDPATPMDNTDFTLQWRRQMVSHYVDGVLRELSGMPIKAMPSRDGQFIFDV